MKKIRLTDFDCLYEVMDIEDELKKFTDFDGSIYAKLDVVMDKYHSYTELCTIYIDGFPVELWTDLRYFSYHKAKYLTIDFKRMSEVLQRKGYRLLSIERSNAGELEAEVTVKLIDKNENIKTLEFKQKYRDGIVTPSIPKIVLNKILEDK